MEQDRRPVHLPDQAFPGRLGRLLRPLLAPIAGRILRIDALNDAYERVISGDPQEDVCSRVLREIGVRFEAYGTDPTRVPATGSLLVVANHPFGGVEGLILGAWLRRLRPDVRIMANHLLGALPALRDLFLFVDPFEGAEAERRNRAPLRAAMDWLSAGHVLVVFPAGEVAHLRGMPPKVTEPPWRTSAARLAMRSGARVLPVHFDGRNGSLFQIAGLIHPRLRTVLLPHELLNKRAHTIRFTAGSPIEAERLQRRGDAHRATEYLRARTHVLSSRFMPHTAPAWAQSTAPIIEPVDRARLVAEVAKLGEPLASAGGFTVYLAESAQIPDVMTEIGRLREIAFRDVGEGTGRAFDTDRFDAWYRHLFVWDTAREVVVGAYRLGCTDEILPKYGIEGLYTHQLFRYDQRLLDQITPAIELGRSFVRPEYQRVHGPLMLLWKGIGRFVVAHPRYRRLFGPVTISSAYHGMSQRLLIEFLQAHRLPQDLAALLRPRHPVHFRSKRGDEELAPACAVADVDEIEAFVEDIESDLRGVPILLRHYLRLNADLLGFSVDPDFASAIDGLMLVDLRKVDPRVLKFYLGAVAAQQFLPSEAARATGTADLTASDASTSPHVN